MSKLLLTLCVLFIAGCTDNTTAQHVSTANAVCVAHGGYKHFMAKASGITGEIKMVVFCNDDTMIEYYGRPQ